MGQAMSSIGIGILFEKDLKKYFFGRSNCRRRDSLERFKGRGP
jgi:hypothetical protein